MVTIVMQRIYPFNHINVFGIFDTKELAEREINKAISAILAAHPNSYKVRDSQGNYTVRLGYNTNESVQFHIQSVTKNVQLRRTHIGKYDVLASNGWESYGEAVFMWR